MQTILINFHLGVICEDRTSLTYLLLRHNEPLYSLLWSAGIIQYWVLSRCHLPCLSIFTVDQEGRDQWDLSVSCSQDSGGGNFCFQWMPIKHFCLSSGDWVYVKTPNTLDQKLKVTASMPCFDWDRKRRGASQSIPQWSSSFSDWDHITSTQHRA